jgi:hypothetical protein
MKKIVYVFLSIFLVSINGHANLTLGATASPRGNWFSAGHDILVYKFIVSDKALESYLHVNKEEYFSLYDANSILNWDLSYKKKTDELRNTWPLARTGFEYNPTEVTDRISDNHISIPLEYSQGVERGLGCLQKHPLRYGDLNGDGSNEIVLFLGNDLVIFSPEYGKIIFSEKLSINDWLSLEDTAKEPEYKQIQGPSPYQYLSSVLSDDPIFEPGYRGYSKLFFGDFNSDGHSEIIVWHKFYESHKTGATAGFKKLHDNFAQYELSTAEDSLGEFLIQSVQEDKIIDWLADAELTWSKGYPSKSECEGMEGKLIPEMHEPLLNDPDVLK